MRLFLKAFIIAIALMTIGTSVAQAQAQAHAPATPPAPVVAHIRAHMRQHRLKSEVWRKHYAQHVAYYWDHMANNPLGIRQAIIDAFGPEAPRALRVAECESTFSASPKSGKGIFALGPRDEYGNPRVGLFQMGTYERRKSGWYDVGDSPLKQARSARVWFDLTGRHWSNAWECTG